MFTILSPVNTTGHRISQGTMHVDVTRLRRVFGMARKTPKIALHASQCAISARNKQPPVFSSWRLDALLPDLLIFERCGSIRKHVDASCKDQRGSHARSPTEHMQSCTVQSMPRFPSHRVLTCISHARCPVCACFLTTMLLILFMLGASEEARCYAYVRHASQFDAQSGRSK